MKNEEIKITIWDTETDTFTEHYPNMVDVEGQTIKDWKKFLREYYGVRYPDCVSIRTNTFYTRLTFEKENEK